MMSQLKKIISKINLKSRYMLFIGAIIGIIALNFSVAELTGTNLLGNAIKGIYNLFAGNQTVEVKKVVIESDGYKNNEPGSWHVEKSADWTGENKAKVVFDVDTIVKTNDNPKDVIFVLDISGSMVGEKLQKVKEDTKELAQYLLSNNGNRVALITFDTTSKIDLDFTNDKKAITNKIDSIVDEGRTNYYRALLNVDKVLKDYTPEEGREVVVLFLTDGFPNEETPNEVSQYNILKEKYSYLTIIGIQYEMGIDIVEELKVISDNQFHADVDTLENVLFSAAIKLVAYEKFEIVDYIDNEYFEVISEDDITVSIGSVKLVEEKGNQKIIWTVEPGSLKTGSRMKMEINLVLKEKYQYNEGFYPTNKKEEITSKLPDEDEEHVESDKTPILKNGYKVIYDGNYPDECNLTYTDSSIHAVYETVDLNDKLKSCDGYVFNGWVILESVERYNSETFIMPASDVHIVGEWGKAGISKSMHGTVHEKMSLYNVIQKQAKPDNVSSAYVSSSTGIDFTNVSSDTNGKGVYMMASTANDNYPIYYYRGDVNDNNVLFADYCWKIVRTTETGGIKLIYNGVATIDSKGEKVCDNLGDSSVITSKEFNPSFASPAYMGYMYGDVYEYKNDKSSGLFSSSATWDESSKMYKLDLNNVTDNADATHHYTCNNDTGKCSTLRYYYYSTTYYIELNGGKLVEDALNDMFSNKIDSTIKDFIEDEWFENKNKSYITDMTQYEKYLEDTIWCNDRSLSKDDGSMYMNSGWNPNGGSSFLYTEAYSRALKGTPSLACNSKDSLTVSGGQLNHKVGLITSDEVILAGATGVSGPSNQSSYLYANDISWTMTPYFFDTFNAYNFFINRGNLNGSNVMYGSFNVRPMVSLAPKTGYLYGDGTPTSPYVIG